MITRNRGDQIRMALEHLLKLPEKPRIIVVDNDSSDGTIEILQAMTSTVDAVSLDQNLGCAGRNVGVLRAQTPYVAFSDDDSWWAPGALTRAADLFDAHPSLGLLAARIMVGPNERLDPLCQIMASTTLPPKDSIACPVGIPIVGFAACGAIVRRGAFLEAGGFEQRLGVGGEEQILALDLLRKGWQLAYIDMIIAYHHPSPVRDHVKRKQREARNALWSAWLRRPAAAAMTQTWRMIKLSFQDQAYRWGIAEAILGLPWVLAERNPVPVAIEQKLKIAETVFHNP